MFSKWQEGQKWRNYKLPRGMETIGGNKTIKMKAGKMPSSVKMCCSKLWGWAAEEAVSFVWVKGCGGTAAPTGAVCTELFVWASWDLRRIWGRGFKLSISDIDLFCHETPLWMCEQAQHVRVLRVITAGVEYGVFRCWAVGTSLSGHQVPWKCTAMEEPPPSARL